MRGVLTFTFEKVDTESYSRRVLAVAKANMGPARIKCDTQPIRKADSRWIIGFEGKDDWSSNDGDDSFNPHFPSIVDIQCGEKAILL